jgi:hypothetical protein
LYGSLFPHAQHIIEQFTRVRELLIYPMEHLSPRDNVERKPREKPPDGAIPSAAAYVKASPMWHLLKKC